MAEGIQEPATKPEFADASTCCELLNAMLMREQPLCGQDAFECSAALYALTQQLNASRALAGQTGLCTTIEEILHRCADRYQGAGATLKLVTLHALNVCERLMVHELNTQAFLARGIYKYVIRVLQYSKHDVPVWGLCCKCILRLGDNRMEHNPFDSNLIELCFRTATDEEADCEVVQWATRVLQLCFDTPRLHAMVEAMLSDNVMELVATESRPSLKVGQRTCDLLRLFVQRKLDDSTLKQSTATWEACLKLLQLDRPAVVMRALECLVILSTNSPDTFPSHNFTAKHLIARVRSHLHDLGIVCLWIAFTRFVCSSDKHHFTLHQAGTCDVLVGILGRTSLSEQRANEALWIFCTLLASGAIELVDIGAAYRAVVFQAQAHSVSHACDQRTCEAVAILGLHAEHRASLTKHSVCSFVASVLHSACEREDTLTMLSACHAVMNLSVDPESKVSFGRLGTCEDIVRALAAAIAYREASGVSLSAHFACGATRNLSANNDNNKEAFFKAGACRQLLMTRLAFHTSEAVLQQCCAASASLSFNESCSLEFARLEYAKEQIEVPGAEPTSDVDVAEMQGTVDGLRTCSCRRVPQMQIDLVSDGMSTGQTLRGLEADKDRVQQLKTSLPNSQSHLVV
jgi:hypothetical protein